MPSRRNARTWVQRGLLAAIVGAVLVFGLRANGSVANELSTVEGAAWLVDPPTGTLVRVNALGQDVTTAVKVSDEPDQQLTASQFGSGAVVLNRSDSTVGRIDGANLDLRSSRQLASPGVDLALVGSDAGAFAVDTSDGRLIALDPDDLSTRFETTITPQQSTPAVVDEDGRLWAFDAATGEVVRFDGASGAVQRGKVTDPNVQAQLTLVNGRPVLVDPQAREAIRITGSAGAGERHCLGDGELGAFTVAGTSGAGAPRLYVLSIDRGDLRTVDLDSDRCSMSLQLGDDDEAAGGEGFGQPVSLGERLFVPVLAPDGSGLSRQVLVVNAEDNRIERSIDLSVVPALNRLELFTKGDRLWFNDLEGPRAGVLSPAGAVLVVDKVEQRSLNATEGGDAAGAVPGDGDTVAVDDVEQGVDGAGASGTKLDGASPSGEGGSSDGTASTTPVTAPSRSGPEAAPGPGSEAASAPGQTSTMPTALPPVMLPTTPTALPSTAATVPVVPSGPSARQPGPETRPTTPPPTEVTQPGAPEPIVANFTYGPPGDPTTETNLTFVDTSAGQPDQWTWTFTAPNGTTTTATGRTLSRTFNAVGAWTVTLTAAAGGRSSTTTPIPLQVFSPDDLLPPTADFTWAAASGGATPVEKEPVAFRDRSTTSKANPIKSWLWEFADGTTSIAQNPSKSFALAGRYPVRLTVTNGAGARSTVGTVTVATPPAPLKPDFTYGANGDPATVTQGQSVTFTDRTTGGPTTWTWRFGDGSNAAGPVVSHVFRDVGEFNVVLEVANGTGSATTDKVVKVVAPVVRPTAKIGEPGAGAKVEVGKPLRFVSASEGNPTKLVWEWDDGTTSEGGTVNKAYAKAGAYTVRLTASNAAGSHTATIAVQATEVPPPVPLVPKFTTLPATTAANPAIAGEPVKFVNASTGPGTFTWNFGDGGVSAERDPTYIFKKAGTYHVMLTQTDGARSASASAVDVFVGAAPVPIAAGFDFTPKTAAAGDAIQFLDQSSSSAVRWTWNFGDGTPSVDGRQPPPKAYAKAGSYQVTLTVADRTGAIATKTLPVVVAAAPRPKPAATITAAATTSQVGKAVRFEDATPPDAPLTTPVFTFATAGATPTTDTAAPGSRYLDHVFTAPGVYSVSVRVCWADDANNCGVSPAVTVVVTAAVGKPSSDFKVNGPAVVVAATAATPGVLEANKNATFTAVEAPAPGTTYAWLINGREGSGPTFSDVSLATAGSLSVTLTVTNAAGATTTSMTYVVLSGLTGAIDVTPSADGTTFRLTDVSPILGLPLGITRRWVFGDGSFADGGAAVDHVYAAPGDYRVQLTISLLGEELIRAERLVTVTPPKLQPQIQATGRDAGMATITVNTGEELTLRDSSTAPAGTARTWSWSDGTASSSLATLTRRFTTPGEYTLTLTTSAGGEPSTTTVVIRVTSPASAVARLVPR